MMKRTIIPIIGFAFAFYILFTRILPPPGEPGFWPLLIGIVFFTGFGIVLFELWLRKEKTKG
jgi:hypothetical protein